MSSACYSGRMLIRLEYSRRIFETSSNMKVHENPSVGNRVVTCRRTDRKTDRRVNGRTGREMEKRKDGRTDITKLIVVCQNFSNTPINWGDRVKTEKLRKDGLIGVTITPVPENLSSLAPYCVNLHIQLSPTV